MSERSLVQFANRSWEVIADGPYGGIVAIGGSRRIVQSCDIQNENLIKPDTPTNMAHIAENMFTNGTQGVFWIGTMRAGKTTTQGILCEEALAGGMKVALLRPSIARLSEPKLARVSEAVVTAGNQEVFLRGIADFEGDFLAIDELNVAMFLEGDLTQGEFEQQVIRALVDKMDSDSGLMFSISLLDRQFNNAPFAPIETIEALLEEYPETLHRFDMQAACVCGAACVPNRTNEQVDLGNGYTAYAPVPLDSEVFGIEDVYIPLCEGCFESANHL